MRARRCASRWPCCRRRLSSSGLSLPALLERRCCRSLICLFRFSISFWREANCDCNSAEASLPSAVVTMAWRMLMTPTVTEAAEPAAAGDCVLAAPGIRRHPAARTAVRTTNLEFTFLSLLWPAHGKPGRTHAKSAWLETDSTPCGLYESIANLKV